MNQLRPIFIGSLLLLMSSCSFLDDDFSPMSSGDVPVDKINFDVSKTSYTTEWAYCDPVVIDFSKYESIDSIVFIPNIRSQQVERKCIAELYNYSTDSQVNNSLVESFVRYTLHFVRSDNLIDSFNRKENTVAIRFRSSHEGNYVEVGVGSQLLIYYK